MKESMTLYGIKYQFSRLHFFLINIFHKKDSQKREEEEKKGERKSKEKEKKRQRKKGK